MTGKFIKIDFNFHALINSFPDAKGSYIFKVKNIKIKCLLKQKKTQTTQQMHQYFQHLNDHIVSELMIFGL